MIDKISLINFINLSRFSFRKLIVATGIATPNIPGNVVGMEHVIGYEDVSIDADDFEGQSVLILGMYCAEWQSTCSLFLLGSMNYH